MDSIVQAILNYSVLEVDLIRIVDPTPTSFVMSIESRVTKTGPLGATMAPMTVDLVGPKGAFGRLDLPEVKTSPKGTTVTVDSQKIEIIDMDAFHAFVKSIQLDEQLTLMLDNGKSTIKALMMTSHIKYKKPVHLKGMNGPKTTIAKTEILPDGGFKNTMKCVNPSPLEIDLGDVTFEFRNAKGEVLASQRGRLSLPRGESTYEMTGKVATKGDLEGLRLVGVDTETEAWCKKTIKFFDSPISLSPELEGLVKA